MNRIVVLAALSAMSLGAAARGQSHCPAPTTLLQTLNNPAPTADDWFGYSIAISGNLAVLGTPYDNGNGMGDYGSASVFDVTTGGLVTTAINPGGAYFGGSVAISGNLAVVGAITDTPVRNTGTAYVFDGTTGVLLATLNNPAPYWDDFFGSSVAISGNLVVVGAGSDTPAGLRNAGTAYVFDGTTGVLLATLNNPAPYWDDFFGISVAISGNLVVVGAESDDSGGVENAGAAYVFEATTGALLATLNNPAPIAGDSFGDSVSISGSIALVSAPYKGIGEGERFVGAAYVFEATTGALQATLSNPEPTIDNAFGRSVAISGDLALVGASSDEAGGVSRVGTAYIFDATNGALQATLNHPKPAAYDGFGGSVAISGNLAVVGAIGDDPSGVSAAGTAYVFGCPPATPTPTPSPTHGHAHHTPHGPSPSPSGTPSASPSPSASGTPLSAVNAVSDWSSYD